MTIQESTAASLARRAHVEALLAAYPDVTSEEHSMLVTYFKRQANALDVAMIASNPSVARGYGQFRGEHLDRFNWQDIAKALGAAGLVVACIVLVTLRGM